jgi:transposase-like protein
MRKTTNIRTRANEDGAPPNTARRTGGGDHLTVADICRELGIAESTFYDWRAKHKGPQCIKLPNGQLRVRRTVFERWLADLEDAA